jgi:hypothetical protein
MAPAGTEAHPIFFFESPRRPPPQHQHQQRHRRIRQGTRQQLVVGEGIGARLDQNNKHHKRNSHSHSPPCSNSSSSNAKNSAAMSFSSPSPSHTCHQLVQSNVFLDSPRRKPTTPRLRFYGSSKKSSSTEDGNTSGKNDSKNNRKYTPCCVDDYCITNGESLSSSSSSLALPEPSCTSFDETVAAASAAAWDGSDAAAAAAAVPETPATTPPPAALCLSQATNATADKKRRVRFASPEHSGNVYYDSRHPLPDTAKEIGTMWYSTTEYRLFQRDAVRVIARTMMLKTDDDADAADAHDAGGGMGASFFDRALRIRTLCQTADGLRCVRTRDAVALCDDRYRGLEQVWRTCWAEKQRQQQQQQQHGSTASATTPRRQVIRQILSDMERANVYTQPDRRLARVYGAGDAYVMYGAAAAAATATNKMDPPAAAVSMDQ